jgi:hypothetical protein
MQPRVSAVALEARLTDLRSQGARILECIKYVMLNQGCSLAEAQNIVVNSRAWCDQKEAFLRHQEDMFEEFLDACRDRIEAIHQTITPEGTEVVVRMKPPVEPGEDTAEQAAAPDRPRD